MAKQLRVSRLGAILSAPYRTGAREILGLMGESPSDAASLRSRFGKPESLYSPTPGKTGCGVVAAMVLALLSLLPLFEWEKNGHWRSLGIGAIFFVPSVGMAFYVWRIRKWKLMVCENGVIQSWASGTESLLWTEVRAVIALRSDSPDGPLLEVVLMGATSEIHIGGVASYDDWHNLLETVLENARKRGIPTRVNIDRSH